MNLCTTEVSRGERHEKQYNTAENQAQNSPIQAHISPIVVIQSGKYTEFSTVERLQWKIIVVQSIKYNSTSENQVFPLTMMDAQGWVNCFRNKEN